MIFNGNFNIQYSMIFPDILIGEALHCLLSSVEVII